MADAPKPDAKTPAKYEPPKELESKAAVQKFQGRPKRQPVDQAEYFYNVKATHIAFFLSSLGLVVGFLMMFHLDYDRPWKPFQQQFAEMDFEKLWYDMTELQGEVKTQEAKIASIDAQIDQFLAIFRAAGPAGKELPAGLFGKDLAIVPGIKADDRLHVSVDEAKKKLFVQEREKVRGELYDKTQMFNFAKDTMGATRYRYEEAKHHYEEAKEKGSDRTSYYEGHYKHEQEAWDRVVALVSERKAAYDDVQNRNNYYDDFNALLESKPVPGLWEKGKPLNELKKEQAQIVKELDDKKTRFAQERPSVPNKIRNAPGMDFFAPTLKVRQHIVTDIKDQLNFAQVTKVDRCDTCHVAIDNPVYEVRINPDAEKEEDRYVFKNDFLRRFVNYATGKSDKELFDKAVAGTDIKTPLTKFGAWTSEDAIKFTKTFMAHPRLDLFVKDSSKHPIAKVGCTICHEGDGRDTDFTRVVHTPNNEHQAKQWRARYGTPYGEEKYNWNYRELWDLPMFPTKFVQASCRRCHTDAVELDGAPKYVEGMKIVERIGCYGCHRMDTYQILKKDLDNPAIDVNRKSRRPGPPLERIATKVTEDWAAKWVLAPRDFRPTTRMPHFFQQSNARHKVNGNEYPPETKNGILRSPVDDTIVTSIVKYVFSLSDRTADAAPAGSLKGDVVRGELLVRQVGCTACHKIEETSLAEYAKLKKSRYLEEFAPTLMGVGSKMNKTWLFHWVKNPKAHFPDSNMPNLRLSEQEAADVVEFLMALKKPDWEKLPAPAVDPKIVDDLIVEILRKSMSNYDADQAVAGKSSSAQFKELGTADGKVRWLGRKMVKNFGCYSCHELRKDEDPASGMDWQGEEGIGVELTGSQPWGSKHADKLDFGFTQEDGVNHHGVSFKHGFSGEELKAGVEETRRDWLENKLRNPRIFDGGKMASKPWDELLRMPNFALTHHEIEAIQTFVLSFTDHTVAGLVENAKKRMAPDELAKNRGDRVVRENNCKACHRFSLDTFTIEWTREEKGKMRTTPEVVEGRLGREEPAESAESTLKRWKLVGDKEDFKKSGKRLWTFSWTTDHRKLTMSGAVSPDSKFVYFDGLDPWYLDVQGGAVKAKRPILRHEPMEGGEILPALRKFKKQLSDSEFKTVDGKKVTDEKYVEFMDVDNESEFETRFPPMLRTQGVKTQSEWLYKFLKAPYPIRPTLQPIYPGAKALPDVNLRMPSFFETKAREEEAAALVHWFADRDQDPAVESYPHTNFPEREPAFLEARKGALEKGGAIVKDANTGCASCHYMSGQAPPGAVLKHAPDLSRVEDRLRPRWLYAWQADPSSIYPGTTMTMYDFKPIFKESKEPQADGVHAAVEYLLNYSRFIQKSSAKQ